MIHRHEDKTAKPPALAIDGLQEILLEKRREECLRKVFGVRIRVAFAPEIKVERLPVDLDELAQRLAPLVGDFVCSARASRRRPWPAAPQSSAWCRRKFFRAGRP